ncbi:MAG: hypothetical protein A3E01_02690 [Gammaproteobacteria bacterium RIFCSPHIGHO2_12_FULL_63_22]|nr:MAG: hypothetical protein A3E01_02690 [Gammaproteobacteria bacterium RIFCSPHIGHO2_12_FULL_63_22]
MTARRRIRTKGTGAGAAPGATDATFAESQDAADTLLIDLPMTDSQTAGDAADTFAVTLADVEDAADAIADTAGSATLLDTQSHATVMAIDFSRPESQSHTEGDIVGDATMETKEDAYTDAEDADAAHGAGATVTIGENGTVGGSDKYGWLIFEADGLLADATVVSATLRLWQNAAVGVVTWNLLFNPATGLDEGTLTWNNQPSLAGETAIASLQVWPVVTSGYVEFDVTAVVSANKATADFTFRAEIEVGADAVNGTDRTFDSKEGTNAPELVVEFTLP